MPRSRPDPWEAKSIEGVGPAAALRVGRSSRSLAKGYSVLLVASMASAALFGCRRRSPPPDGDPAPPGSVFVLGVGLGGCPDVAACERECDAGSADRCRRLGVTYAFGQGVEKDEARATALYEHACDMKDPSACMFAGQNSEFAHGVDKDYAKAARFYERACDLRWAAGCYNLAVMYERGTGEPLDRQKAGELYQIACTAGAREACDKAREMHEPPPVPFLDGGWPI